MKRLPKPAALAALIATAALAAPVAALEIAEVRGDFYYDSQGSLVGHRNADLPEGLERRPMSHKEKFALMGLTLPAPTARLAVREVFPKPARVDDRPGLSRDKVIVKFTDDVRVRLRDGRLRAGGGAFAEVDAILARYPDASLHRVFDAEERILDENRETGELLSGKALADLNNLYVFTFETPSERGVALANELLALDTVESAYLQAPGQAPGPCGDVAPATPNWEANQTYLDAAPTGLDSRYAWAYHAGGDGYGPGYWVADLEWDWCTGHEDIPATAADVLNGLTGAAGPDHGTAVLGIIGACNNGFGMTGMVPDVTLKMCDFDSELTWAANIQEADVWLVAGEVMLLEIHILGPDSGLTCVCNCAQHEYVPVEWDLASFLAIQTATANGIIVVEAGGNGSMNLDSAIYGGWFNPANDSGAILVGAGAPGTHAPECWTNSGSRINVHGWGSQIYTMGYFDLWWGALDCTQDYTATFGGTSGASPMIVSAAASLQGIAKAKYGVTLSAAQMRALLPAGGTPQGAPTTRNIGPMPDLENAINALEPDVVPWAVPGGWTYPIVPRDVADADGGYAPLAAPALPGNVAGTYFNWTESNASYSYTPTLTDPKAGLFVDDGFVYWCNNWNLPPGQIQFCANGGPNFVKGGRHTLLNRSDVFATEEESSEANDWARQYIWSPLALATNAPVQRTYDPPRISTGYGPYYNAEGFSGTTASYWTAFAVSPTAADSDFDVHVHNEAPMNIPQQGFGASLAMSSAAFDYTDFVIVDRNVAPSGTYYASAINWTGTADKVVEADSDQGVVSNPGVNGPYNLGSGEIVDLHEIFLSAGVPTRIHVRALGGTANVGLSVHQDPSGFSSKWSYVAYADNAGPGEDEWVIVDRSGWHGIAVWKRASGDLGQSLDYNLIVSQLPNLTDVTPAGWYGPLVPRNTTDSGPNFVPLPAVLDGNVPTTSYNFSTINEGPGTAAGWQDYVYVDDLWMWFGTAGAVGQGGTASWINTGQGYIPNSVVRGGRHHLRLDADPGNGMPEALEDDNTFVEWFAWTPLALSPGVPVARDPGSLKDPVGFGPDYSCDGFTTGFASFWTAVGVLPASMGADYDVRTHAPYVGSKDGFNGFLDWSGDAQDGAVDFAVVNYNVAGTAPDFSVLNWNASGDPFVVERAEAYALFVANPGVQSLGPFTEGPNGVLEAFEMYVPPASVGLPVYVSLAYDSGDANLGIRLFDGTAPYHNKWSSFSYADFGGPGADEHIAPVVYAAPGYQGIVVHKTDATDLPKSATYRLVISVGAPVTDAPVVEAPPTRFALASPRPNPFASETSLRFDVPAGGGAASVVVYDVNGRKVATLAEGERAAGRHTLTWDGRDTRGERVAAGVYFVRLESSAVSETRKITRLR